MKTPNTEKVPLPPEVPGFEWRLRDCQDRDWIPAYGFNQWVVLNENTHPLSEELDAIGLRRSIGHTVDVDGDLICSQCGKLIKDAGGNSWWGPKFPGEHWCDECVGQLLERESADVRADEIRRASQPNPDIDPKNQIEGDSLVTE